MQWIGTGYFSGRWGTASPATVPLAAPRMGQAAVPDRELGPVAVRTRYAYEEALSNQRSVAAAYQGLAQAVGRDGASLAMEQAARSVKLRRLEYEEALRLGI